MKIVVSDPLSQQGIDILKKVDGCEVIDASGLPVEELCEAVKDCDALVIRSGTKVTKQILEAAKKLKLIGRAGVGVDNVDVPEATKRGIVVMNTPDGNTISTAEHTMAMILSVARSIPQAHASMKAGKWDRKSFKGVELSGKVLGIIGMGRIGSEVAKRARAFNMTVLASDPFLSPEMARKMEIEIASFDDIVLKADFITVHTPLTDATRNLINAAAISKMKKGVRIINCARGGIVNEADLVAGIEKGIVAGAALDVYPSEPPTETIATLHPKVVTTPHLGASTTEAQEKVALDIAEQIVDALKNNTIRNSVNAPSVDGELLKVIKPYIELAQRIGLFLSYVITGQIERVKISFEGKCASHDMSMPTAAFMEGLLKKALAEEVNTVNALHIAKARGISVEESKSETVGDFADLIRADVKTSDGDFTLTGTFFGIKNEPRIVQVNQYYINAKPYGSLLYVINKDKPGIIGQIGDTLGRHSINIADMTVGRISQGEVAVTLINIDQPATPDVISELNALEKIVAVRPIEL
ncbi:MAG: phosphoglycerate dehydrogenase [Candidatus Auribacter fodinae]|jgi:D-3-phosphoglycerate dehydrogenase|uniref:D-3-phosphoglycerate dehydrogenase n=1 Tax=Candidatus Auribacter fodinae TaxID=2093366 RepID=A0A3A4R2F2_9BACT|nr:MAG: phosphoglycerate dehydrogenase [Candidatus Auribacter fodinae]